MDQGKKIFDKISVQSVQKINDKDFYLLSVCYDGGTKYGAL